MKQHDQIIVFLKIELDFLLIKAWFSANKLDKAKP